MFISMKREGSAALSHRPLLPDTGPQGYQVMMPSVRDSSISQSLVGRWPGEESSGAEKGRIPGHTQRGFCRQVPRGSCAHPVWEALVQHVLVCHREGKSLPSLDLGFLGRRGSRTGSSSSCIPAPNSCGPPRAQTLLTNTASTWILGRYKISFLHLCCFIEL
jgi:hypothetical protein